MNLGKVSGPNQTASWHVLNIPADPQPSGVRVLFNFTEEANLVPSAINVIVNGHAHSVPWPYPDATKNTWRTFATTIPVTDLVPGTNVVEIGAPDEPLITANVNIVLADVPGRQRESHHGPYRAHRQPLRNRFCFKREWLRAMDLVLRRLQWRHDGLLLG